MVVVPVPVDVPVPVEVPVSVPVDVPVPVEVPVPAVPLVPVPVEVPVPVPGVVVVVLGKVRVAPVPPPHATNTLDITIDEKRVRTRMKTPIVINHCRRENYTV